MFRSGWSLVRCTPKVETSCGQVCYYIGQVDLLSDGTSPTETSCGQVWYYFKSVDIWTDVQVRLTFGQMYPQCRDILWPNVLLLQSGWPLVRCTLQQTSCGQVSYYFSQVDLWSDVAPTDEALGQVDIWSDLGQVDLWSDVPPAETSYSWVLLLWVRLTFCQIFGPGWPFIRCTPLQRHLVAECY